MFESSLYFIRSHHVDVDLPKDDDDDDDDEGDGGDDDDDDETWIR